MDATSIITLSDCYEFLSVPGSKDDTLIQKLINRKTSQFENYCGVDSFFVYDYEEYYDGLNSKYLFIRNNPINSITSIYDDSDWSWGSDTLIDSDDYRIVNNSYIVYKSFFSEAVQNIKIIYNAGYSVIPEDLKEAMVEEVTRTYNRRKEIDIFIKTLSDGSQHRFKEALLPTTRMILSKYKQLRAT